MLAVIITRRDLQKRVLGNIFHLLLPVCSTRDLLPMSVSQTFQKQKHSNSNLGGKCQKSVRGKSRSDEKLRRDQLILAEIDLATDMDNLDHSGFIFDRQQTEAETLDSKIANEVMKINPAELKRKINTVEETQYKKKHPTLEGRQIMFQIFLFSIIKKNQEPINLSASMDVELYDDNVKKDVSIKPGTKHC